MLLLVFIESMCVLWFSAGDMYEVGAESGRYYCLNVPLRDGIDDQSELTSFTTLLAPSSVFKSSLQSVADSHINARTHIYVHSRLQAAVPAGH